MKTMWVLSAVAVCGLLSGNLFGATINVPGDYPSIQEAVDASNDGDEIVVGPGTYTSTQDGHVVDMKGKAVTLRSSDGAEATIIDGENARRGIAMFNYETAKTVIKGFTITNGTGVDYDYNGNGNSDFWEDGGGGFLLKNADPTINQCIIEGNNGRGMFCYFRCDFYMTGSQIINNTNGGIELIDSDPEIVGCTISGNESIGSGGGIYCVEGSDPIVRNSTISNNIAGGTSRDGGGVNIWDHCWPEFINCTISGNSASGMGGGIFGTYYANPTISGCVIRDNSAVESGGGVEILEDWKTPSEADIENTNFCNNQPNHISGPWSNDGGNTFDDACLANCCVGYDCISDTSPEWCKDQGGFWSFLIDCDGDYPCGVPEGACCIGWLNTCLEDVAEPGCAALDGNWGVGLTCEELNCVSVGACCYSATSCVEELQPFCEQNGGVYLGAETMCSEVDCSNLESACCFDYECEYLTEDDCESQGGYLYGYNYSCDEVDCGPPGGCCFETSCEEMVEFECLEQGGFFQGSGTPCDDWWTCPVVSCCIGSSNNCYNYTPDYCLSIGGDPGDSSCGDWDPCIERGSCCLYGYGECYDWTTQDECESVDGYWIMSGECQWAPCMRGNCCVDGECMQLFYEDCMAWGGDYSPPVFGGCEEPGYYCSRTLVVDASGNGDYLTIQEAVDEANDTDTVLIRAGTYTGSGDASVPVVDLKGKAIHLQGEPKRVGIIYIDGEGQRPCIVCNNGESLDTVIELVECINGSAEKGGALYCLSSPTITNCAFRDSSASVSGGGVYIEIGEPVFIDCEVTGNDSPFGGGYYILNSNTSITGGLIGTNSASNRGGGLRIYRSSPVLTNVDIQGNWATRGGAAHSQEDGVPVFDSCMITDNMADSLGGGLATSYNSPAIYRGCTFTGNQATGNNGGQGSGGAIYSDNSPVVVENCLIDGNTADTYGGGIYCWYSSPVVTGTKIKGNTSGASGGAIRTIGGTGPSLDNDILCGNSPDNIAGPWDGAGDNCLAESCLDNNENELPDECECEGDTNEDGVVDITDLLAILDGWGGADGDVTGDGDTNIDDILIVLGNWGFCS